MIQETHDTLHIKSSIVNSRMVGENEQDIYNLLVSEGYNREYIVQIMIQMVHPINVQRAKIYNRVLIAMMIVGIVTQLILTSGYMVYNIVGYVVFIYFFTKNTIVSYYWYIFFSIIGITGVLLAILEASNLFFSIIGILVIALPILLCYKIISILLPHKDGKGIGITQEGAHIFLSN